MSGSAAAELGGDIAFPIKGWCNLGPTFTRRSVQIG